MTSLFPKEKGEHAGESGVGGGLFYDVHLNRAVDLRLSWFHASLLLRWVYFRYDWNHPSKTLKGIQTAQYKTETLGVLLTWTMLRSWTSRFWLLPAGSPGSPVFFPSCPG